LRPSEDRAGKVIDLDNLAPDENEVFNVIALEIRQEFNALVESMSRPHVQNLDWIVSSLASRNKYYSPLFIRCCRLAFVKRLVDDGCELRGIVVADRPLAGLIREYFKERGSSASVRCSESLPARAWRLLRPYRQYVIAVGLMALRCLGRSRSARARRMPSEPIVLIDTFVLNNDGDEGGIKNGAYKDRYFSGLWEQLSEEERERVFYAPTIVGFKNPWSAFREIRATSVPFLIHDDYLNISDYLYILGYPFRVLRLKIPVVTFRGFAMRGIAKQEMVRNCSDFISLLGILYFRFALRLAERKVRVRLLIDWYENQVMDRGMIVGFHRFHPDTKIVGYQGYVIATRLHIYTHPNNTEQLGQAVPDVVTVTGEGLVEDIREFCSDVRVNVGPGFRFRKLWRERHLWPDPSVYSVLIALPIGLHDSAHILRELTRDPELFHDARLRFAIKPHPTWSPERIRQLIPRPWPSSLDFVTGDFHDSLETSKLLITNASSVSLEALAKGVPVIIVAPASGVLQNPIPSGIGRGMWTVVQDGVALCSAIRRFAEADRGEPQTETSGNEIRRMYFEPVTRETVARFLELK